MRARSWLPLLPLVLILSFGACGGGGCGETGSGDLGQGTKREKETASGAAGKKTGGVADFSEFDSKSWQGNQAAGPSSQRPGMTRKMTKAVGAPRADWLEVIQPEQWDAGVLGSKGPVMIMVSEADCEDCAAGGVALKNLERKFPEWNFRRLDGHAPEAPSLLPKGLKKGYPVFLTYEGGKVTSKLEGLPFPRSKDEPEVEYRGRLRNWFRDAVTQKNLAFNKPR